MRDKLKTEEYLRTAFDIGAKLSRDAVWHEDRCSWISYFPNYTIGETTVYKKNIGSNLDYGNAGILLFLNRLLYYYQDPILLKTAQACRNQILHQFDVDSKHKGYFKGSFGQLSLLINTIPHDSTAENVQDYLNMTCRLAQRLVDENNLSYINGLAGIIEPSIGIVQTYQFKPLFDLLYSILDKMEEEVEKESLMNHSENGYANSRIGIHTEMLRLSEFIKDTKRSQTIIARINKEFQEIKFDINKWWQIHFNQTDHQEFDPFSMGWKDGLCGTVESKLAVYELSKDLRHKKYAKDGLKILTHISGTSIQKSGWFSNFSYNHGLAGIGLLLIRAFHQLEKQKYLESALSIGEYGIRHIHWNDFDWPSDIYAPNIFGSNPSHGFLNGIAGTGMFYLDLYSCLKRQESQLEKSENDRR